MAELNRPGLLVTVRLQFVLDHKLGRTLIVRGSAAVWDLEQQTSCEPTMGAADRSLQAAASHADGRRLAPYRSASPTKPGPSPVNR